METLFRFNVLRDATRSTDEVGHIDLAAPTRFQNAASAFPAGAQRRGQLRQLAERFVASNRFVGSIPANSDLDQLDRVSAGVDVLLDSGQTTRADLTSLLSQALATAPAAFVSTQRIQGTLANVTDSILAIKLSPANHRFPLRRLAGVLRAYHLVTRFANDPTFPLDVGELAKAQARPLRVPASVLPTRPTPAAPPPASDVVRKLKDLATTHDGLTAAMSELRAVRPAGYATVPQAASGGVLPPTKFRPAKLFESEQKVRLAGLSSTVLASGSAMSSSGGSTSKPTTDGLGGLAAARRHAGPASLGATAPVGNRYRPARPGRRGRGTFATCVLPR
jgi:hypothetical protein